MGKNFNHGRATFATYSTVTVVQGTLIFPPAVSQRPGIFPFFPKKMLISGGGMVTHGLDSCIITNNGKSSVSAFKNH